MSESILAFLFSQIFQIPLLLIYLGAVAIAIVRRRTLGTLAVLAGIGFGLLAVERVISAGFTYWQLNAIGGGISIDDVGRTAALFLPVAHTLGIVGIALIAMAALRIGVKA